MNFERKVDDKLFRKVKDLAKMGWTQSDIAEDAGISQRTVSSIIKAKDIKDYFDSQKARAETQYKKGRKKENETDTKEDTIKKILTEVYGSGREIGGNIWDIKDLVKKISEKEGRVTLNLSPMIAENIRKLTDTLTIINNKLGAIMFSLGVQEGGHHDGQV